MHRTNIGANQVPPGALVSFLQRGIQYVEMQSNLNEVRFYVLLLGMKFCLHTALGSSRHSGGTPNPCSRHLWHNFGIICLSDTEAIIGIMRQRFGYNNRGDCRRHLA